MKNTIIAVVATALSATKTRGGVIILAALVAISSVSCATSLFVAAANGDLELAQQRIAEGSEITWFHRNTALYNERVDMVQFFLEQGVDVNNNNSFPQDSPIGNAARTGNAEIVQLIVDAGADVNKRLILGDSNLVTLSGNRGWTPLAVAIYHGYVDIVDILIKAGADVNKTISGRYYLQGSRNSRGTGVYVEVGNGIPKEPLRLAQSLRRSQIATLLVAAGAQ